MFESSSKKVLLTVLVASFVFQTGLVYSDDVDLVLSDTAVEGRKLFHDGGCQVCHQLWGQGGFLGPDLTNAASRVDETRLASLLTIGSGQMPAYGYSDDEIAAMRAFLAELDRPDIGRGQLRLGQPGSVTPQSAFDAAIAAAVPQGPEAEGFALVSGGICAACHFPFQTSVVGAPDLSTVATRLARDEIDSVLRDGRPELGMPPPVPALGELDRTNVIAYLTWLGANRDDLYSDWESRAASRDVDWSALPWWEYR